MEKKGLHLGIIPDGSRRWAKLNNAPKNDWSKSGKTTENIVMHVLTKHPEVSELSLWAMSTENVDRDDYSRNLVYSMLEGKLNDLLKSPFIKDKSIKVNVVGSRFKEVPESIKDLANEVVSKTRNHNGRTLNICIGYGGRQEILDAVMSASKWLRKNPTIAKIHESMFEKHLLVPKPLDIVIRTGGEKRLSGFMLYQIEYAELFFTDTLWPDFSAKEFDKIMEDFKNRNRRFGI
jgi:undecaprenyl diphosphate synthase